MYIDASLTASPLRDIASHAAAAEALGFDAVWTSETQHDPFLPLALVAEHTRSLHFGTAVAIGFARSPTVLAHTAWDLADMSGGRFLLGLGTQVRAHVERRFGMPWPASPVGQLREYIAALRAVWAAWQSGERLDQRGEYYKLTLMTPFFSPGAIDHPAVPIYIAGVNQALCRLAGEAADGLHVHPYHSVRYLREVVRPAVDEGRRRAGRREDAVAYAVSVFAVTDDAQAEFARSQIAFYASTPSYRAVMAAHGWEAIADQLGALARRGAWGEMGTCITDEMLQTFAVVAPGEALAAVLRDRYQGLADRLTLYLPFRPGEDDAFWRRLIEGLKS
ncbi:MAG TPA: TIGR03617 family F420-dependent LLM class oxidoreductase [Anaerolineales bacterium]|nr:TIGR03617 family F420-dependent LLM class oxidoreductase [Anaerolineales bacterium]